MLAGGGQSADLTDGRGGSAWSVGVSLGAARRRAQSARGKTADPPQRRMEVRVHQLEKVSTHIYIYMCVYVYTSWLAIGNSERLCNAKFRIGMLSVFIILRIQSRFNVLKVIN